MSLASLLIAAVCCAAVAVAQNQCEGTPNTLPIWQGTPTFVKSVPNGQLLNAYAQEYNQLPIAHVYGTPYQMGYAHGQLMYDQITKLIPAFYQYLDQSIAPYFSKLPKFLQEVIETDGAEAALMLVADLTAPFTPTHFTEELQGLSDALAGSSVTPKQLLQMQMFPELVKASCTMFGAWGPAISTCEDLELIQLRALDFGLDSPLVNYTFVNVYHPLPGNGHTFASVTWTGFIGTVTPYSNIMGVSEKVWDGYNGTQNSAGIPFNYLLRDIAQYDLTTDDSLNRIYNAKRTCAIWIGLGSNYTDEFRIVNYSFDEVYVWDDRNFPAYPPVHPLLEGVVFVDKHVQPSMNPCLGSLLTQYYGNYTAENTIANIVGPAQTGDLHSALYDFGHNLMYVGQAGAPILPNGSAILGGVVAPTYSRPWFQLDMNAMFALPLPQQE